MASQRLIIAKIGGRAAEITLGRFRYWASQRTARDPHEWSSEQWPTAIRAEADEWFQRLRQNALAPPVLFYAEYNDYWSFCPPCRFIGEGDGDLLCVYANRYEGFCATLPLKDKVVENLERVSSDGQHNEDRIFAWLTLHAARDWAALESGGALVFLREVLRECFDDREVSKSLAAAPDWMSDGNGADRI